PKVQRSCLHEEANEVDQPAGQPERLVDETAKQAPERAGDRSALRAVGRRVDARCSLELSRSLLQRVRRGKEECGDLAEDDRQQHAQPPHPLLIYYSRSYRRLPAATADVAVPGTDKG